MIVAAGAFLSACLLFLVPLVSRSLIIGLPLLWLAGAALYGSNPPLDVARLDIMPHWLWGRAEGVRTLLRSVTTAIAPLLFGLISDLLGGSHQATNASGQAANSAGISYAFLIMLIPLAAGGLILLGARQDYREMWPRPPLLRSRRAGPALAATPLSRAAKTEKRESTARRARRDSRPTQPVGPALVDSLAPRWA